ncbi:hypothetical protein N7445_002511 [Penicillium cf. griseofulvum]|nr:hypothetical protein N7445_002511 [Penicillium cf. griseofulvum]
MCHVNVRVYKCGHYTAILNGKPCDDAVKAGEICDPPNVTTQSTIGTFCYQQGCDKKQGGKREGLVYRYNSE